MNVFMLGWEFPPFISGGLGTACYGLTRAMSQIGIDITFVLPKIIQSEYATHVDMLNPESLAEGLALETVEELENLTLCTINSALQPYDTSSVYQQRFEQILKQKIHSITPGDGCDEADLAEAMARLAETCPADDYSGNMYNEVYRYAALCAKLAQKRQFDIVHAHDWMTFPAGVAVAKISGRPLVVQVHSTEFDRSGENVNQMIYDIERRGMHAADRIIAVSNFTRGIIINRYGISPDKVQVVHNGVDLNGADSGPAPKQTYRDREKLVLFLGRITMQKGPEYFLHAAKRVLDVMDDVRFVMAGSGDLMHRAVEIAAELGIANKVVFTGFLRGQDVQQIYQMADLFVMPSVSEPFGLVPLEALDNGVPVIISKQSGVSEVLTHALKVDFWDIEEMANKIIAVLKYQPLKATLQEHGHLEVQGLQWKDAADKCVKIYEETLRHSCCAV